MVRDVTRVLLVDDDEDDFVMTRDLLLDIEGVSFALDWEHNYDNALAAVKENRHDICLFDYRLGDRDGLELLREALASGCETPVILLTGQGDRQIDMAAMDAGAADFLIKGQITAALLERSIRYSLERHRVEQKLARMAHFDPLTGLANRLMFGERLRQAIALAHREERMVGLLFLDLDRFKNINDTLGHTAGDALLQAVAHRLEHCVRGYDTISRLGGDEFVVILPALPQAQSIEIVARRVLEAMNQAFILGGQEVFISASIGIALYPLDGSDAETLLKNADTALYKAKEVGRNTYKFFSLEMNEKSMSRLTMEGDLRRALEKGEFHLHYQPQIDLKSERLVGVEALLRWQPRGRQPVPAQKFIPLLEETGMILPVGEWVLRTACSQMTRWREEGAHGLRVAVNVSGRQLIHPGLCEKVEEILAETGLPPECLEIELTESIIMHDCQENIERLGRLKRMGVQLTIDDFGTGYSSLSCLKYFPIDRLKIDQSFVCNLTRDRGDEAITRAIIAMAQSLMIRVIAEGIETEEQLRFLRLHGCEEGQGYYFGRPAAAEDLLRFLSRPEGGEDV